MESKLITTNEAAEYLRVSPRTLEKWRLHRGYGPHFYRLGDRVVRYSLADLDAWVFSRRREGKP